MRDLKFRFWDREDSTMNECIRIELPNNTNPDPDNPHGVNVMQYTGLKDKNGKEIFEGDIVDVSMSFNGGVLPHRGEIVYVSDFGAFATSNQGGETLLHNHCLHTMKIIGNIYESPELLEETK